MGPSGAAKTWNECEELIERLDTEIQRRQPTCTSVTMMRTSSGQTEPN